MQRYWVVCEVVSLLAPEACKQISSPLGEFLPGVGWTRAMEDAGAGEEQEPRRTLAGTHLSFPPCKAPATTMILCYFQPLVHAQAAGDPAGTRTTPFDGNGSWSTKTPESFRWIPIGPTTQLPDCCWSLTSVSSGGECTHICRL